jgi:hypothetical protein
MNYYTMDCFENAIYEKPFYKQPATKTTLRVPAIGGTTFVPGQTFQIVFPETGYLNPETTTLAFDVTIYGYASINTTTRSWWLYFQNDIKSIFKSLRLWYGSELIENVPEYAFFCRQLTELTTDSTTAICNNSIFEGIASTNYATTVAGTTTATCSNLNARLLLHGQYHINSTATGLVSPSRIETSSTSTCTKRYQITFPFGLFGQKKLIPLKWLANQLVLELVLAPEEECMMGNANVNGSSSVPSQTPTYTVSNVQMIAETMEFDSSYDEIFLNALKTEGIPIQISTVNYISKPVDSAVVEMYIPEKSRSLKNLFVFLKRVRATIGNDFGASYSDVKPAVLEYYQTRIGNRFYPSSPVICTTIPGFRTGNCEPFLELKKSLYKMNTDFNASVNGMNWAKPAITGIVWPGPPLPSTIYGADDGSLYSIDNDAQGFPGTIWNVVAPAQRVNPGSSVFCMATNLELSGGIEISGLNAEEQQPIIFTCKWSSPVPSGFELGAYTEVDKILIMRENNVLEIVE